MSKAQILTVHSPKSKGSMPGQASQSVNSMALPTRRSAVRPPKPRVAFHTGLHDADAGSVSTGGQLSLQTQKSHFNILTIDRDPPVNPSISWQTTDTKVWTPRVLEIRIWVKKQVMIQKCENMIYTYSDGKRRILANASGSSPYPSEGSRDGRSSAAINTTTSLRSSLSNHTCSCARAGGRSLARSERSCSFTHTDIV